GGRTAHPAPRRRLATGAAPPRGVPSQGRSWQKRIVPGPAPYSQRAQSPLSRNALGGRGGSGTGVRGIPRASTRRENPPVTPDPAPSRAENPAHDLFLRKPVCFDQRFILVGEAPARGPGLFRGVGLELDLVHLITSSGRVEHSSSRAAARSPPTRATPRTAPTSPRGTGCASYSAGPAGL